MTPTLKPNRKATLNDVARHAGVALSTASAALNGKSGKYAVSPEKMAAVMRAVEALSFEVNPHAKRLVTGRDSDTIGLFTLDFDTGVGMQKLREIQYLLVREGYNVPIYSTAGPDIGSSMTRSRLMASLRLQQPRAIVSASNEDEVLPELRKFVDDGGILVMYDRETSFDCDKVLFDRQQNTYEATAYLLKLGHRSIGFYHDGNQSVSRQIRFQGFTRALNEYGGYTREEWLVNSGTYYTRTIQEGGGELLARTFLGWTERPTAMVVLNDASASAFVSEIQRAGVRVPEDLSVVGHDNLPIGRIVAPRLSTVRHPVEEISSEVTHLLLSRLSGHYLGPSRTVIVQGHLIERESAMQVG
ncbi:MAG TPA: LacI family DNA-binding transcriptional regulator [Capsulimonadaceae bacterium]